MVEVPIAFVQCNRMIVDLARHPELMVDILRTLLSVQFELVCFHDSQLLVFCVSTYRLMVALLTFPAVETK